MDKKKNIPQLRFPEFHGEWGKKQIIDVAPLQRGFDLPQDNIREGKYPVVFSNGILAYHNEYKVKGPGVVTGRSGTIGKVTYVEENFWAHNTSLWVTDFKGNDPKYIFYFYSRFNLEKLATGSGVPTLNRNDIHAKYIYFPSYHEQQKIASFFTAIDHKISQLKRKKTLLELYKEGVMQKIFSQEIRFKDNNGQEFPKWEKKKFGEIYSFKNTNSFSRENLNYENGTVRNIHYGDIHTKFDTLFDITKEDIPYVNEDLPVYKISAQNYCQEGDLVFADASEDLTDVGKSIELVNLNNETVLSGLHTILARPDLSKLAIGFGGYLMKSNDIRKQIMKEAQGSKVSSISATKLSCIQLNIPVPEEQTRIANFLSAIDDKISHTQKQIEKAEVWKKGLMQQMFV